MRDEYEDFDAETEDVLDELLGQYQNTLLSSVSSALDMTAGFRQATAPNTVSWTRSARVVHNQHMLAVRPMPEDSRFVWEKVPSEALLAALDAVHREKLQLEEFADDIAAFPGVCPAPPTVRLPPELAVQMAVAELRRINELLGTGNVTKRTAPLEFNNAEKILGDQALGWGQALSTAAVAERRRMYRESWLSTSFMARLDSLLLLREKIIKLFEDAPQGAFQLS
ncbi:hypothetical protein ACFWB1_04060 [Streptomyces goshikiensis]|uniref:hypothetical protein n=1 Tax=Streptomyces goshikiensis TaxID=1942 RepID=UPI0033AB4852